MAKWCLELSKKFEDPIFLLVLRRRDRLYIVHLKEEEHLKERFVFLPKEEHGKGPSIYTNMELLLASFTCSRKYFAMQLFYSGVGLEGLFGIGGSSTMHM